MISLDKRFGITFLSLLLGCPIGAPSQSEDPCEPSVIFQGQITEDFIECPDGCILFDADGDTRVDDRVCQNEDSGCTTLDLNNNGDIDNSNCQRPSGCSFVDADGDGQSDDSFCIKEQGCFVIDINSDGTIDQDNCPACDDWQPFDFSVSADVVSDCNGERFVTFDSKYQTFIGAILCSPTRYKILMADSLDSAFFNIGDTAGGGQDHCELVNPDFSLPDEDDITSGGCATCSTGLDVSVDGGAGFVRDQFGESFSFNDDWFTNILTASFYECGIALPVIDPGCTPNPSCLSLDRDSDSVIDTFDCSGVNGCVGSDFNNDGIIDAVVCDPGQAP